MKTKYLQRKEIFEKSGGRCWYCGVSLTIDANAGMFGHVIKSSNFVIDHFIAKKNGGDDEFENLVPSCSWCNRQKSDRDIEDFREHMTRLSNNIPKFSDEQLYYLKRNSIELPYVEKYSFYFEEME